MYAPKHIIPSYPNGVWNCEVLIKELSLCLVFKYFDKYYVSENLDEISPCGLPIVFEKYVSVYEEMWFISISFKNS